MSTSQYNPNVPQAKDIFASSSKPFMNNFQDLFNAFLVNHVSLTAGALAGNHTIIQLTEQEAPFQTDVGEISIYTKDAPGQTDQIFMRYQGNQQEFQFTNYQIYQVPIDQNNISFFSFLPGRILVYFGAINSIKDPTIFNLTPPIAKYIVSCEFCARTTPNNPPWVSLPSPINNIYKSIQLNGFIGDLMYVILANV